MKQQSNLGSDPHPSIPSGELRCACGSLLARCRPGWIELKCRRCKRSILLRLAGDAMPQCEHGAMIYDARLVGDDERGEGLG